MTLQVLPSLTLLLRKVKVTATVSQLTICIHGRVSCKIFTAKESTEIPWRQPEEKQESYEFLGNVNSWCIRIQCLERSCNWYVWENYHGMKKQSQTQQWAMQIYNMYCIPNKCVHIHTHTYTCLLPATLCSMFSSSIQIAAPCQIAKVQGQLTA